MFKFDCIYRHFHLSILLLDDRYSLLSQVSGFGLFSISILNDSNIQYTKSKSRDHRSPVHEGTHTEKGKFSRLLYRNFKNMNLLQLDLNFLEDVSPSSKKLLQFWQADEEDRDLTSVESLAKPLQVPFSYLWSLESPNCKCLISLRSDVKGISELKKPLPLMIGWSKTYKQQNKHSNKQKTIGIQ